LRVEVTHGNALAGFGQGVSEQHGECCFAAAAFAVA
jgi:hypothetical protein